MKIDYKILWFEDIPEWYNSIIPFIEEYLVDQGFNLIPDRYDSGENLEKLIKNNDFDLILVDYNLPGELGDKIIEKIRSFSLYTNIIFYSQDGESKVRAALQSKSVEGVYCANRNKDDFEEKVTKIIDITIKKVQDVNNMRGLVIASTSDLDIVMEDIISKRVKKLNKQDVAKYRDEIKTKFIDSLNDRIGKVKKLNLETEFDTFVSRLESSHKWRATLNICREFESLREYEDIIGQYNEEVIKERNKLAHLREETDKNGIKILKSTLTGDDNFIFNEAKCIEIRSNLRKYQETLNKIKELI
jgi:CheY-like chemotaxis protein